MTDDTWKAFMDVISKRDDLAEHLNEIESRLSNFMDVYRQDRYMIENILEKTDNEINGLEKFASKLSKDINTLSDKLKEIQSSEKKQYRYK